MKRKRAQKESGPWSTAAVRSWAAFAFSRSNSAIATLCTLTIIKLILIIKMVTHELGLVLLLGRGQGVDEDFDVLGGPGDELGEEVRLLFRKDGLCLRAPEAAEGRRALEDPWNELFGCPKGHWKQRRSREGWGCGRGHYRWSCTCGWPAR